MKIIDPSGQAYHLNPETKLELTRYNPFFHEKGEQSIPITLPASDHNLALLQHPESTAGRFKIDQRLDAQIQSGIFSVNARQAILSAKKNESIETSFYLGEGAFYEKIKDVTLQEIVKDHSIKFATIDAAISFMHSLIATNDHRFACFQVVTDDYILNQAKFPVKPNGFQAFVKEQETTEIIDGKTITVPKGFYITPFIKIKYLLQEVLAYFGYTLGTSILDLAPFSDMCFLNNTIDTIVNNQIDYVAIVPAITVSEFLQVLRKFNLEFIPDEKNKVVDLMQFNDMINSTKVASLDKAYVGNMQVNYSECKRVMLTSEFKPLPAGVGSFTTRSGVRKLGTGSVMDANSSLVSILAQFPTVYLRKQDGAVVRDGVNGTSLFIEIVGSLGMNYDEGGVLEAEEKTFPDVVPGIYTQISREVYLTFPYVGAGRTLYSTILLSNEEETEQKTDNIDLEPMLCLNYKDSYHKFDVGTLSNYNHRGEKLWDHSLMYNGAEGIFEKFWRRRDDLLRNALLEVDVDLLLTESSKFTLSGTDKVSIDGQHYLLSELNYTPQTQSVESSKLLSIKLQNPISAAKSESDYFSPRLYKWQVKHSTSWTPKPGSGTTFRYKTNPVIYFPPHPTADQYAAGGKYYQKTYEVEYGTYNDRTGEFTKLGDGTVSVWLIPVLD